MAHGLEEEIQDIFNIISKSPPTSAMDVNTFKDLFWPAFSGKTDDKEYYRVLTTWVNHVSGSATVSVALENANGTVIGLVPPIMEPSGIEVDPSALARYKHNLSHKPYLANNKVDPEGTTVVHSDLPDEVIKQWADLYALMGEEFVIPTTEGEVEIDSNEADEDDMEWS